MRIFSPRANCFVHSQSGTFPRIQRIPRLPSVAALPRHVFRGYKLQAHFACDLGKGETNPARPEDRKDLKFQIRNLNLL